MGKDKKEKSKTTTGAGAGGATPESGSGAYKCKGCDAYTFGAPYRLDGQNYCKYCLEKQGIQPEK